MQHSLASSCAPSPALTHAATPLGIRVLPGAFCRLCPHNSAHLSGEGRGQQLTEGRGQQLTPSRARRGCTVQGRSLLLQEEFVSCW